MFYHYATLAPAGAAATSSSSCGSIPLLLTSRRMSQPHYITGESSSHIIYKRKLFWLVHLIAAALKMTKLLPCKRLKRKIYNMIFIFDFHFWYLWLRKISSRSRDVSLVNCHSLTCIYGASELRDSERCAVRRPQNNRLQRLMKVEYIQQKQQRNCCH